MGGLPETLQRTSQPAAGAAPRQIGGIVVAAGHGETDALRRAGFGHEDFRACIGPHADSGCEVERAHDATLIAGGGDGLPQAAWLVIRPRRLPRMEARRFGEKFVNRPRGRPAEDVDFEMFAGTPHERQAQHRIAEVVEFDNEQSGFHRANQRRLSR